MVCYFVLDKPIVTFTVVKEGSDDYAEMGTEVKMQCSAVGFPSPKLALSTKENSRVQEIQSSMNAISYSISDIQPNDAKTYVCSATNAAGASSKEKQINVKCKLILIRNFWLILASKIKLMNFQMQFVYVIRSHVSRAESGLQHRLMSCCEVFHSYLNIDFI